MYIKKEKKYLSRKYLYFILIRLDYYIIFFIFLFKSQKEKAFGIYFGNYYFFFFFVQPMVYLWLREEQKANVFLTFKFLFISIVFYSFFLIIENILLPQGHFYGLFYIPLFALYLYLEGSFKIAYKYVLRLFYKETYFEYFTFHSDKFYFEKNVNKLKKFRQEINKHSKKVEVSIFKKNKKKLGELLEDILFLKKEKKHKKLKIQRKNEINEYLAIMKKRNLEKKKIGKNFGRSNFNTLNSINIKSVSIKREKNKIKSPKRLLKTENKLDEIKINISNFGKKNKKNQTKKTKLQIIINIMFFPFIYLFKYTLPDKKINKTYKSFFFGIIIILIYKIGLIISLYYLLEFLQEITKISNLIKGLIFSLHNFSYLLYMIYSPILNNYFLYNTLQEMSIFDIGLSGSVSGIFNIFLPSFIERNYFFNVCRFSTFCFFMLIFFFVVIYNKSFFPVKLNFFFFLGFLGIFFEEFFIN